MLFILLLKCWLLCSFGIPKPMNYFVLFHCFFKHFLSGIKWFIVYIFFFFFFWQAQKVYYYRYSTTSGRPHREIVCLVEMEATQRCTCLQKGGVCVCVCVPPVRRSSVKRPLSHLYRSVLPGLCLPSGQ